MLKEKKRFLSVIGQLRSAYEQLDCDPNAKGAATNLAEMVIAAHPLATNFAGHFHDTLDYLMHNETHV